MTSNTWDGLSVSVSKEEVSHAQYALRTCERVLAIAENRDQPAIDLKYLKQSVKKARRNLWGAEFRESNFWSTRILGTLFKKLERCRMAIFRRSPWFPRVKITPIEYEESLPITFSADVRSHTSCALDPKLPVEAG
jgi:hypothetical protein